MKWSLQSHNFCNSVEIYIYLGILRYRPEQENRTIPIAKLREPWKSFLCLPLERYDAVVEEGGKNGIQVEGGTGWAGG
jgi:hypothetical protein